MFQLYDFNIVYCAIATVSAAVGYRYTRRRSERSRGSTRSFELRLPSYTLPKRRNSDASQAPSDVSASTESDSSDGSSEDSPMPTVFESISDVTEPGSLKRKVRDDDDVNTCGSPQSETGLEPSPEPPRKRCRTPSEDETDASQQALSPQTECQTDVIAPPARAAHASEAMNSVSPAPTGASSSGARPATIPSSFTVPACRPSDAFAAFAGTASAFAATQSVQQPAWCRGGAGPAVAESTESTEGPPAPSSTAACDTPDGAGRDEVWQPKAAVALAAGSPECDPLAAPAWAKSTHVVVTGEEDEDVKVELKGAKLFVKRGSGDFSTGMIGHMKLLSHRTDKSERLVFRREPVWKVSMSVGLRPAVRCSFDEDQGILRVTLKETISDMGPAADQQVVLYALKRGRVPRDEFAAFAQEVVRSSLAAGTPA